MIYQQLLESLIIHEPSIFKNKYQDIYEEIKDKVRGALLIYGEGETKRKSCVFGMNSLAEWAETTLFSYSHLPKYEWTENLYGIRKALEDRWWFPCHSAPRDG